MKGSERLEPGPSPVNSPPGNLIPVEQHLDRLFAYAYRLTGSHDLAEELTQQTFLVAQQRVHQLRDPAKLGRVLETDLDDHRDRHRQECPDRSPDPSPDDD